MKEQQAVLDFFAKIENLSLGLAVSELIDKRREQMNTQFWVDLQNKLGYLVKAHHLVWTLIPTEDRYTPESLVGLYCDGTDGTRQHLRPMFEQQNLGNGPRIYFGLMWHSVPTPEQLALPIIVALKNSLEQQGFKQNEGFLAWQWTNFHPRRSDFLLRYTQNPTALLDSFAQHFIRLVVEQNTLIVAANQALAALPPSSVISFKTKVK